jgi:hypothetical protein
MEDFKFLLVEWERILQKIEMNNGDVHPIEVGQRATIQEIEAKEEELGYRLPPSFTYILQNVGKSLSFHYSFSKDTIIPSEFQEIFSGEINWNIDYLENLNRLADDLMEDGEDYGATLRGKLEFAHAGNGDVYAFDMSVDSDEKPVIYWDHEEDTVTYLADSFIDYLSRITELSCIGSEKWQFDYFLSKTGLDITSPAAVKWKQWFESFSETTLEDVKNNLEQLTAFVVYREELDEEIIDLFQKFNRDELLEFFIEELYKSDAFNEQKILCEIIGRVLGKYAEKWINSLWEATPNQLDPRLRSYLTSKCTSKEKGLHLVFHFLEQEWEKISGYEALLHLGDFHSRDVIAWMEKHVTFPVTDGWDELFVRSDFSWADIDRWTSLEEKHEATAIHALELYVHEKVENNRFPVIRGLPSKSELINFLVKLRAKQVLKKRIVPIDCVIQNIDIFY